MIWRQPGSRHGPVGPKSTYPTSPTGGAGCARRGDDPDDGRVAWRVDAARSRTAQSAVMAPMPASGPTRSRVDRAASLAVAFGFSVGLGVATVAIPLLALDAGYDEAAVGFLVATSAVAQLGTRLGLPWLLGWLPDRTLIALASLLMLSGFALLLGQHRAARVRGGSAVAGRCPRDLLDEQPDTRRAERRAACPTARRPEHGRQRGHAHRSRPGRLPGGPRAALRPRRRGHRSPWGCRRHAAPHQARSVRPSALGGDDPAAPARGRRHRLLGERRGRRLVVDGRLVHPGHPRRGRHRSAGHRLAHHRLRGREHRRSRCITRFGRGIVSGRSCGWDPRQR